MPGPPGPGIGQRGAVLREGHHELIGSRSNIVHVPICRRPLERGPIELEEEAVIQAATVATLWWRWRGEGLRGVERAILQRDWEDRSIGVAVERQGRPNLWRGTVLTRLPGDIDADERPLGGDQRDLVSGGLDASGDLDARDPRRSGLGLLVPTSGQRDEHGG